MYGAQAGSISLFDLMSVDDSGGEVEEAALPGSLRASPEVEQLGRPKDKVFKELYEQCPNITVIGEHVLDPSGVAPMRHTRDPHVVSIVNRSLPTAGKARVTREALEEADRWIYHQGSDHGWVHRVMTKGSAESPPFEQKDWLDGAYMALHSFPLNQVDTIEVKPKWYLPNMDSSCGLPDPSKSKKEEWPRLKAALLKIEKESSYKSVTEQLEWKTGYYMLKSELHKLGTLREKARAYYCFPGLTSVSVGAFLSHFTKKCRTFSDDHTCTSLVGVSFYHGGATALRRQMQEAPCSCAAYYGDDALMVFVLPSGRRYHFLPDVSSMDMNTPEGFKELWLQHVSAHWTGDDDDTLWVSGMNMYAALFGDAEYLLPGAKVAKLHNFSTTGMAANTHYQTFVNTVVWHSRLKPLVDKFCAEGTAESSKKEDFKLMSRLVDRMYLEMEHIGVRWKPGAYPKSFRPGSTISGILGHTLKVIDEKTMATLAFVPLPRLTASLINGRTKPTKSGTALVEAYGRAVALSIAGGYEYPQFLSTVKKLHKEVLCILPTLNLEHKTKLAQISCNTGFGDLGADEPQLSSLFSVDGATFLLKAPLEAESIQALRLNPSSSSVSEAVQALFDAVKVSSVAHTKGKKGKKKEPKTVASDSPPPRASAVENSSRAKSLNWRARAVSKAAVTTPPVAPDAKDKKKKKKKEKSSKDKPGKRKVVPEPDSTGATVAGGKKKKKKKAVAPPENDSNSSPSAAPSGSLS